MLRKRAVAVALTALLSPIAFGLGLGALKTSSALNEPFDAHIEIVGAAAQDFDALTVKLADPAQFDRAGVARDAVLLNLRFVVVSAEAGADYVRVTTKDPVREPFLNFLLELDWAKGRLVREYTVLLDPPLYDRNRRPATTQAASPVARPSAPLAAAPTVPNTPPAPASVAADGSLGAVQANDTAWGLALAHRPDRTVSVQQMMLALLRANPAAFIRQNVNQLRRGAILRMPTREEMGQLAQHEAVEEIQRQHQLWQDYRQGVVATVVEPPASAPDDLLAPQDATPKLTPKEAGSDAARLELAAPDDGEVAAKTPGGEAGGSLNESLAKEDLDAKAQENTDLQAKLSEADQIIDLLQRQVKIKDEELAALQARLGDTPPAPSAGVAATDETAVPVTPVAPPTAETTVAATPEVSPPAATPITPPAEPPPVEVSGWQGMLNNLVPAHVRAAVPGGALTVLGIAATLVVLLLIGLSKAIAGRQGKAIISTKDAAQAAIASAASSGSQPALTPDALLATREDLTAFDAPKPDTEQFLRTMEAPAEQLVAAPDKEDPLEEVNVYLAYERFDQAEELVSKVIAKYPYEHKYKLRLLEIFYSANNKQAYEEAARVLHAAVGDADPLWESAVAMWNEMSPERALFAPGRAPEMAAATAATSAFVDITGDTAGGATMSLPPGGDNLLSATQVGLTNDYAGTSTLDFDLSEDVAADTHPAPTGLSHTTGGMIDLTATTDELNLDQAFDLTGELTSAANEVFDISGEVALDTTSAVDGLDLLDVTNTNEMALDSLDSLLDVTSPRPGQADRAEAATINAVADKLSQEFDISDTVAPAVRGANTAEPSADMDEGSLDFDIEGLSVEAQPVADDDFDLTLDTDIQSAVGDADADLDLSLDDGLPLDFNLDEPANPQSSPASEVEFDLALQDTTDFESLAIDDTLELPKSNATRSGMRPVEAADESLEDLTRSMEASIAGLDLSDDQDDDSILDLALEPDGHDGIDLDFGLDDIGEIGGLDTLALDPEELRRAADAMIDKTVALPRDAGGEYQNSLDETDTKLNLAKAYIELGDGEGARAILNDVEADGSPAQQAEARNLLSQLT